MQKAASISVRIKPEIKKKAEAILKKLGLKPTAAINLYYNMIIINQGIPFEVNIPNNNTLNTLLDVEENNNIMHCKDSNEMFKKLGI